MAGIYIHIPFCSKICHYCDFYKTANNKLIPDFVNKLIEEIVSRKNFLSERIDTIYFGGGTPSALSINDLQLILGTLHKNYNVSSNVEATIEVNPDDISSVYYKSLIKLGFNRLSIGIQSFNNNILKFLNRKHNNQAAQDSINLAIESGFSNISSDLIYGIPGQSISDFKHDLSLLKKFKVNHISAYHLGIEERTYFGKLLKLNRIKEISESKSEAFFNELASWAENEGFEHYEISNFARDSDYSQHNMNYWFGVPYIGLGPSAHSFDGKNRYFNIGNINKYLQLLEVELLNPEIDELSINDKFNEFILLRLRTKWGVCTVDILNTFSKFHYYHTMRIFLKFKDSDYLRIEKETIYLTRKGFFASDFVVREFFLVE